MAARPGNKVCAAAMAIAFASVFIDLLGMGIILPVMPFLAIELNATSFDIGLIYAGFAIAQMISTPISGRLSDRFGRRCFSHFSH